MGRQLASGRRVCASNAPTASYRRSEEHTSELQSRSDLVCRLLLEKKNNTLALDRKSTRLNSSHDQILPAISCLKRNQFISLCGSILPRETRTAVRSVPYTLISVS